ncbi:hypothetical protein SBRY_170018 [Actinacidiphila bryophytorum]|uniref:Uncharacterized protein n=1 Tax=Actinacidiphila bryophytorum TaxID=1436133 RepID=A0A9W4E338_9ACTN|nr:hypothetical protein SBRY_170018 [Actinacidiphila bryophytorum]
MRERVKTCALACRLSHQLHSSSTPEPK